tara:strand:+ start:4930 stop:6033 length:1104 start_codon:yes stop_codon:yes gene_type:complete
MPYQDLVGLLTGTPTQPIQPVTRNQRLAQGAAGGGRAVGKMFGKLIGKEVPDNPMEQLEKLLPNMSPDNPDDLAQLAKLQLASGNSVGAARTLAQRQAILNEEKADTRYAETQKTAKEIRDEARERYETGLETSEEIRDEARERFDIQEKRLADSQGKLLKDDKKRIFDATQEAGEAYGLVGRSLSLANRYAKEKPTGGIFGSAYEGFKAFVGGQDEISALKTEFDGLVNERIVGNLPPGVASDRDIELIKRGFPNSSWSGSEIEQWLRATARVSAVFSAKKDSFADYLNNNSGNAAGFNEQWKKTLKSEGFVDSLYKEYGLGAVTNASDEPRKTKFDQGFADSLKPREEDKSVAETGAVGALLKSL